MKKIIFSITTLILISFPSCQQEQTTIQYFEQSPEIEIAKKAIKAFENGDLEAYRSCYADTARLWHNQNYTKYPGKTIDDQIEFLKTVFATSEYRKYEDGIWEMIIQNDGENWVHFWGNCITKLIGDDKEIEFVAHFAFSIIDNKIVYESGIFDSLPLYLAQQRLAKESN